MGSCRSGFQSRRGNAERKKPNPAFHSNHFNAKDPASGRVFEVKGAFSKESNPMSDRKCGVWIIGALGSISAAAIAGAALLREDLIEPAGMITSTILFEDIDLVAMDQIEFAGCDIREGKLLDSLTQLSDGSNAVSLERLLAVKEDLEQTKSWIKRGTCRNCGPAIESLAASDFEPKRHMRDDIDEFRCNLREFKREKRLETVVVVNLASTEPPIPSSPSYESLAALERSIDEDDDSSVRASTLYSYSAVQEGCPYVNFTPSTGALTPAIVQLAGRKRTPLMGNDGKTGETLVKSALAPMFLWRNLEVLSWEGFNILGNMDGCILENPENKSSKLKTKDHVLSRILGYSPHSRVHIDYVPSLHDQKTAWNFIHFRGFLDARMSLQFIWQGYDSLLAAPLVLDLVRLMELAHRRGEYGLMPHLASYFKEPLCVQAHSLHEQVHLLAEYVRRVKEGPFTT